VNSVLLYNFSPFLVNVRLGTSNAWLGAWMVDKFTVNNQSITCTPVQSVGGAAANSAGNLTAAWILEGDDLTDVGTYPAPLFHLAQSLTIVWPDGDPAIQLGPGPVIEFLDDITGMVSTIIEPQGAEWINATNTGLIIINPNGDVSTGNFPAIDFQTALTSGAYTQNAWIQANADHLGNAQIGINNCSYDSSYFPGVFLRERLWLTGTGPTGLSNTSQLGNIEVNTETLYGGQLFFGDGGISMNFYNAGTKKSGIVLQEFNNFADNPIQVGAWTNLTMLNGWSANGAPFSTPQYRLCSDGFIHFRGVMHGGTLTDGTLICNVPNAFAPPQEKYIRIVTDGGGVNGRMLLLPQNTGAGTPTDFQIFGLNGTSNVGLDGLMYESAAYMS
jgi:hypothetical protein